jgi:hypothetical protein
MNGIKTDVVNAHSLKRDDQAVDEKKHLQPFAGATGSSYEDGNASHPSRVVVRRKGLDASP